MFHAAGDGRGGEETALAMQWENVQRCRTSANAAFGNGPGLVGLSNALQPAWDEVRAGEQESDSISKVFRNRLN